MHYLIFLCNNLIKYTWSILFWFRCCCIFLVGIINYFSKNTFDWSIWKWILGFHDLKIIFSRNKYPVCQILRVWQFLSCVKEVEQIAQWSQLIVNPKVANLSPDVIIWYCVLCPYRRCISSSLSSPPIFCYVLSYAGG